MDISRLKLGYAYVDGIRAQRIFLEVNIIRCRKPFTIHQRGAIAYLVPKD
jgi:hypothetical protein